MIENAARQYPGWNNPEKSLLTGSNVFSLPGWLNAALYGLTAFEDKRIGEEKWKLPAGSSIICRLKND